MLERLIYVMLNNSVGELRVSAKRSELSQK
jgi:hypothetical protein